MYIDSHAHYDLMCEEGVASYEDAAARAFTGGVTRSVQVSIDPAGFAWSRDFASRFRERGIFYTLGIHPSSPAGPEKIAALKEFTASALASPDRNLLFGIGECGLDYFRMRRPKEEQMASFEEQILLAKSAGLPVIVHSRDAMEDTLSVLKRLAPPAGIMHCFPGNAADAKAVLDLGFYVSFAGNVTYAKALPIQEAARYVPADRILIETDAPFLTPVPHRGRKNSPELVRHTYEFIAGMRNVGAKELAEKVWANFDAILAARFKS